MSPRDEGWSLEVWCVRKLDKKTGKAKSVPDRVFLHWENAVRYKAKKKNPARWTILPRRLEPTVRGLFL